MQWHLVKAEKEMGGGRGGGREKERAMTVCCCMNIITSVGTTSFQTPDMHTNRSNIKTVCVVHIVYACVTFKAHSQQQLFPQTALTNLPF